MMIKLMMPNDELVWLREHRHMPQVSSCNRCKFSPQRNSRFCHRVVMPVGNPEANPGGILIVGQSPGDTEDEHGVPLCGPQYWLVREFKDRGFSWDEMTIMNMNWCHPGRDENDRFISANVRELEACRWHLSRMIEILKPSVIVTLGADACRGVEGRGAIFSIRKYEPRRLQFDYSHKCGHHECIIMPMEHPASLSYNKNTRAFQKRKMQMLWAITWLHDRYSAYRKTNCFILTPEYVMKVGKSVEHTRKWFDWLSDKPVCAIDFETWKLKTPFNTRPFLGAVSWEENHAFAWWLDQAIPTADGGYQPADWYSEGSAKEIMTSPEATKFFQSCRFIGQHIQIEMDCLNFYGQSLQPNIPPLETGILPLTELMIALRTVVQTQRVNLDTLLQVFLPSEWQEKSIIDKKILPPSVVEKWGFASLAMKPPADQEDAIRRAAPLYAEWQSQAEKLRKRYERKFKTAVDELVKAYPEMATVVKSKRIMKTLDTDAKRRFQDILEQYKHEIEGIPERPVSQQMADWLDTFFLIQTNRFKYEEVLIRVQKDVIWTLRLASKYDEVSMEPSPVKNETLNVNNIIVGGYS